MNILVTGANGFIGRALCRVLTVQGHVVRSAVRSVEKFEQLPDGGEKVSVGDIGSNTEWSSALEGIDAVVHLAARVHIFKELTADSLEAFRKVNVLATERLALAATKAGVKRFIFISSVKVNGEGSSQPYTESDCPNPQDAYGISKREAEDVLRIIAAETGMEVVILRLPLVYGPGVGANFKNLTKLVALGVPLPFKNIDNQRSFIYLGNLIDAIAVCVEHPKATGETFLISDGEDVSTPDLMKIIANALGKKLRLFSLPYGILRILCKIAGKSEQLEKLTGTLLVDSSKIRDLLDWKPPFSLEEGIKETVKKGISV
ncbi:MAG: SDR family oxidoreductase [Candidatus Aceula meridiana]|nr:SDR family oxidoreductase [Candidatus Aceula meridiana]